METVFFLLPIIDLIHNGHDTHSAAPYLHVVLTECIIMGREGGREFGTL